MNYSISNNYVLKWELNFSPHYKFTKDGVCINTKTGNIIRKILNGRSKGYCINGKFKSENTLRRSLKIIENAKCPF